MDFVGVRVFWQLMPMDNLFMINLVKLVVIFKVSLAKTTVYGVEEILAIVKNHWKF